VPLGAVELGELRKFKTRRETKDWCAAHCPGSPIKEFGADAVKRAIKKAKTRKAE
jgi:hypothetical protein